MVVKQVEGAGNSNRLLNYSAIDPSPFSGISYYRLKQTDYDGQYEYSQIEVVNFTPSITGVVIYPNPTNNRITIQANAEELSTIKIYNILGKDVTNQTKQISKSDNQRVINVSNLARGLYTVKTITTANKMYKQ
ncbi:MAG: hypothetical protein DSY76_00920 [Bacteroidetes bacterium]|nr:MAG: hypothetical protein DSY76_00920 [Bacteroidota bacterium]